MTEPDWYKPPQSAPRANVAFEAPATAEYAGFGIRAGARVLDAIVGVVLGGVTGFASGIVIALLASSTPRAGFLPTLLLSTLGNLAYHVIAESMGGATIGKAVLGLRVRSETLGRCPFGAAIIRSLLYYVDAIFFGAVAHGAMSKSLKHQRVGDGAARTVVVYARSLPPDHSGSLAGGIAMGTLVWTAFLVGSELVKFL